jgi:hypothetical protein
MRTVSGIRALTTIQSSVAIVEFEALRGIMGGGPKGRPHPSRQSTSAFSQAVVRPGYIIITTAPTTVSQTDALTD